MVDHVDAYPIHSAGDFKAWQLQHPNAAILLDVMIFRWRVSNAHVRGKPGKWAAFPAAQWCKWSTLSHDQFKRALRNLELDRLVIRERHRFGGVIVHAYIQPTCLALTYKGKEGDLARLGKPFSPTSALAIAPASAPTNALTDHTTNTTITTPLSSQQDCDPPLCIAPNTDVLGKTTGGEHEKGNVIPFPTPKMDSNGIPAPLKAKPHVVWRSAYSDSYPGSFSALSAINNKQLKDFVSKCPSGYGGNILDHALRHWNYFIQRAKHEEAAFSLSQKPATGFLLKFIASAVNLWLDDHGLVFADGQLQHAPPLKAYVISTPTTSAAQVQFVVKPTKRKKVTKEEFLAIMNSDDDDDLTSVTAATGGASSSE